MKTLMQLGNAQYKTAQQLILLQEEWEEWEEKIVPSCNENKNKKSEVRRSEILIMHFTCINNIKKRKRKKNKWIGRGDQEQKKRRKRNEKWRSGREKINKKTKMRKRRLWWWWSSRRTTMMMLIQAKNIHREYSHWYQYSYFNVIRVVQNKSDTF